jgi:transcriptional regulator GlxA family with amidase domain
MAGGKVGRTSSGGLAPWQVELASRLLLGTVSSHRTVAELARRCGLSRSHFSRAFKASLDLPPHQWLMRLRIERARERLGTTSEDIADIAITCGFADQSHMTRVFHDIVGTSPAAWRRRYRAGVEGATSTSW